MKLVDLLFDRRCMICDTPIKEGAVCQECDRDISDAMSLMHRTLQNDEVSFDAVYLFGYDNPTVQQLLFALKKFPCKDLIKYAADLYEKAAGCDFHGIVTNCPRGRLGYIENGFDQVAEPCKFMCKNSGGRMKYQKLLRRRGASKQQKKLSRLERKRNASGKFSATKKDIRENILLVDDVVTTGSTALECAGVIKRFNPEAELRLVFLASSSGLSDK